jgi:phenylpyruvate tautomerase PptA (4-oxalocrotonate tautomerase family)
MPIMDVRYAAGGLDKTAKATMAAKLTDVLIRMEGGANTHGGRAFASVLFTEIPEENWWVGGRADNEFVSASGKFLVHVTIPEGYMNAAHKTEVHVWVTTAIMEATRTKPDAAAGSSIQVILNEVPEGNWGAGGHTISLESIAEAVGMNKDSDRFAWVRSYFEAKARQLAAFKYPSDVGGLLPSIAKKIVNLARHEQSTI